MSFSPLHLYATEVAKLLHAKGVSLSRARTLSLRHCRDVKRAWQRKHSPNVAANKILVEEASGLHGRALMRKLVKTTARDSHSEHAMRRCPPGWHKTRKIEGCYSPEEYVLGNIEDDFHSKPVYREHIRGQLAGYFNSEDKARAVIKTYKHYIDHGWREHSRVGEVVNAITKNIEHGTAKYAPKVKKGFFSELFGRDPGKKQKRKPVIGLRNLGSPALNERAFNAWKRKQPLGKFKQEFVKRGWDLAILNPKTGKPAYRWRS